MIKIKDLFIGFFLVTFFQHIAFTQKLSPGPQVLTFFSDVDDTEQPYGLYLPKNFDETKKYPLVVMLHGAGSNHRLAMRRVFGKSNFNGENDVEATKYFPEFEDVEYIVASPYARGTAGYQGVPEKDVWDVVADVKRRFKIDEDRMYLTGLSMGGGGTLWIGLTRPDVWAAIAPVCPAPPKGTDDLAVNALNFPLHFFHGDNDQAVPVAVSREWVKRLKELGSNVEYKEYPGVGHNSWENAYKDNFIFDWFSKFKRNPFPDQVRFATTQYKYDSAYWVHLDELTPGKLAKIDAKFSGLNQLTITTRDIAAFTLKLAGHPKAKMGESLFLTVDGKKLKTSAAESISLAFSTGKWVIKQTKYQQPAGKHKGAEGPIKEAFASRHIYVYGTAGNPTEQQLRARIDSATKAANWSFYRGSFLGRIMAFPRIVADKEVRPSDLESANLILFGTKETNTLINKFSDQLPIQLSSSATEYGLLYVFPLNGHYVAINSGLPWWTGFKGQSRFSLPYLEALPGLKDYILFKENINSVVRDGYFEKDWNLSDGDAKALKESGVVEVKSSVN
jgi:predicted esterase